MGESIAPEPWTLRTDAVAGVSGAVGSVPDGMAASVLVGVNPIHGLYASFAGRIAGGLSASTRLMVITTTSAAALAAGSALEGVAPASPGALFLLTVLAGVAMIVAGGIALGLIVVLARTRVATPGAGLATNGPPADARSPRGGEAARARRAEAGGADCMSRGAPARGDGAAVRARHRRRAGEDR